MTSKHLTERRERKNEEDKDAADEGKKVTTFSQGMIDLQTPVCVEGLN